MVRKKKKGVKKNTNRKMQSNENKCQVWELFKEYNYPFLANSANSEFNLKKYIKKDTFIKLNILPSDYLSQWEKLRESGENYYLEFGKYIIEKLKKFRPTQLEGFNNVYILDQKRYQVNGNLYLFNIMNINYLR